ncbi:MAG: hypothetical protein AAGE65_10710 [Planctomycetota bacterium]
MIGRACCFALLGLACWSGSAHAQSLRERIDATRLERATAPPVAQPQGPTLATLLDRRTSVRFEATPFDDALRSWSRDTGVGLLINRPAWDNLGVDRAAPVTVQLDDVPAAQALLILLDLGSDTFEFVAEPAPGGEGARRPGLQVRTKQEANRDAFVRVYDVRDLVMEVPNFTDAPSMDLDEALRGEGGSTFEEADDAPEPRTMQERGDALAETIRQSVEPYLWRSNGGDVATARFRNGRLIVRAPGYVHAQIAGGTLEGRPGHAARRPPSASQPASGASQSAPGTTPSADEGVAGVSSVPPRDVAGVAE